MELHPMKRKKHKTFLCTHKTVELAIIAFAQQNLMYMLHRGGGAKLNNCIWRTDADGELQRRRQRTRFLRVPYPDADVTY